MCRAKSEGGQRCVSHAQAALDAAGKKRADAVAAWNAALAGDTPLTSEQRSQVARAYAETEGQYRQRLIEYASTPQGRQVLSDPAQRPSLHLNDPDADEDAVVAGLVADGDRLRVRNAAAYRRAQHSDQLCSLVGRVVPNSDRHLNAALDKVRDRITDEADPAARTDIEQSERTTGWVRNIIAHREQTGQIDGETADEAQTDLAQIDRGMRQDGGRAVDIHAVQGVLQKHAPEWDPGSGPATDHCPWCGRFYSGPHTCSDLDRYRASYDLEQSIAAYKEAAHRMKSLEDRPSDDPAYQEASAAYRAAWRLNQAETGRFYSTDGDHGGQWMLDHLRESISQGKAAGRPVEDLVMSLKSKEQAVADYASDAGFSQCPACGQFVSTNSAHTCPEATTDQTEAEETDDGAVVTGTIYSGMDRDERVEQMKADLDDAVGRIVESGQLGRYLELMASDGLGRWSWNNRVLATTQVWDRLGAKTVDDIDKIDPADVNVMSANDWKKKFGRYPMKGEKAIWVLAPYTRKIRETDDETGEVTEKVITTGFKAQPKFNVTQTNGPPLPETPVSPASGDVRPGVLTGLRQRIEAAGYGYDEQQIPGCDPQAGTGPLGYTHPSTRQVVVDGRLSPAQKASTIAHELAHIHCGHVDSDHSEYLQHRGRMETEAEATAYMVNRHLGLNRQQSESFSPGYIAVWSNGDRNTVNEALGSATKAFNDIVGGDWPDHDED